MNDKPLLVWHLGYQKTGSRSIQEFINDNEAALADDVALFVKFRAADEVVRAAKRMIQPGRYLRHPALRSLLLRNAVRKIRSAAKRSRNQVALISEENILGNWMYHEGRSIFDVAEFMIPQIVTLSRPARCHIIVYKRDFEKWLRSAWRQEVLVRRGVKNFDEWCDALPFPFEWEPHEARLSAVAQAHGAPIEFRDMGEDAAEGLPIGGRILRLCGLDDAAILALKQRPASNVGVGEGAIQFMLGVNRSEIDAENRKILRAKIHEFEHCFKPKL